jgi:hydroxymethylbilane synthase
MIDICLLSRRSPLALWQTEAVRDQLLQFHPNLKIRLSLHTTDGDREQDKALQTIGGKDLFAKELQKRIVPGSAAVHSLKDLSVKGNPSLCLTATLKRANPSDALISRLGTLAELPAGARVGTASPRRQSQLLAVRPDLRCQLIRGNVGSRLAKLDNNEFDAIVLAQCGLERLGLAHRITEQLDCDVFVPAIGQGVIAVECLANDQALCSLFAAIHCSQTAGCVAAERAFNAYLGGDCFSAIAAHAQWEHNQIRLQAFVGSLDGQQQLRGTLSGDNPVALGTALAKSFESRGARDLLHRG